MGTFTPSIPADLALVRVLPRARRRHPTRRTRKPPELPSTLPPPPSDVHPSQVEAHDAIDFAKLYPVIRRVVRTLRPGHAEDDIAQEAALRVLGRWGRFTPPSDRRDVPEARRRWVATIAFYVAMEHREADARLRSHEVTRDPGEPIAAVAPSAEADIIGAETIRSLERGTTPERWRAFWAHHVEGRTAATIARECGAPLNTVYTWIREAGEDLRAHLARLDAAQRGGVRKRRR